MSMMADDSLFIPSSVRAAISIRNAAEDPRIAETVIENMVASEPMVAAALLRLANSAAFRRQEPAESVGVAIKLLGMGHVRLVASQVAMLQLVRGIRGRAARMVAEGLLLHSISIATFAEELARLTRGVDPRRVATLALFHEMPTFHFLAGSNQAPERYETLADICHLIKTVRLRSFEMLMQDFSLPSLAIPRNDEWSLVDQAHAYVAHPNPIALHPEESGDNGLLPPERVFVLQATADAAYVTLVEGPVPADVKEMLREESERPIPGREEAAVDAAAAETGGEARLEETPRPRLLSRLHTLLAGLFGR